jgi:hypothetical protein
MSCIQNGWGLVMAAVNCPTVEGTPFSKFVSFDLMVSLEIIQTKFKVYMLGLSHP